MASSDDFNRADSSDLGTDWAEVWTFPSPAIDDNQAVANGGAESGACYIGESPSAAQSSEATITSHSAADDTALFLRADALGVRRYYVLFAAKGGTGNSEIFWRLSAGSTPGVNYGLVATLTGITFEVGERPGFEVDDAYNFRILKDGVEVATATDIDELIDTGYAGVYMYGGGKLDDWVGGALSTGEVVDAALESISLSTFPATVKRDSDIAAAIESLALQAFPAAVSRDEAISAGAEQIALSAQPAAVVADIALAAGLEQITLATFAAQPTLSAAISAVAEQITLGTFLSVISSDRAIDAAVESIALQTYAAGVSTGSAIGAQPEQIALETLPAQVTYDTALNAQMQAIILSALSAQVGLAEHLAAGVESLTLTAHGATIQIEGGIQATIEQLTLQTFLASIQMPIPDFIPGGLEYTIRGDRMHFTLPVNRLHFTFKG